MVGPSTAASSNVASPTRNVCPIPTTWRCPSVQITAAVGAGGLATAGWPATGLLGAEAVGAPVSPVGGDAACDADGLAGVDPDGDGDADAVAGADGDADALAGADADKDELAGADADDEVDGDADAGLLAPATGTNGSCDVMCPIALTAFVVADVAAPAADAPPVAAGVLVAGVVTDGEPALDDEPELCISFGSWKASTPANTANRPTRRIFLRRSAAVRAASRRLGMCLSIVLMSPFSRRQTPISKSRIEVWSRASPERRPRPTRCT